MNEAIQRLAVMLLAAAIIGLYSYVFIKMPDTYATKGMVRGMNNAAIARIAALEALATDVHKACATLKAMDKRLERIEDKLP